MADKLELKVAGLEVWRDKHAKAHEEILQKLEELHLFFKGNGSLTLIVEKTKFRFAGSVSLPKAMTGGATGVGGLVFLLGKAFGWW
jgi:hypothetical protein